MQLYLCCHDDKEVRVLMNREFKVKLSGCGYHNYVGWQGLVEAVGREWAKRLAGEAFSSGLVYYCRRLRRGLKIEFYSK